MADERIQILKDLLLELHHGASAESVQERFNKHFKGVSAIEISMMEHELMNSDTGITFEDVMGLCNVHANLFKGAIADVDVPDAEQEGHPVKVFKDENLALRAAIMRIRRIIENYAKPENEKFGQEILKGLKHQFALLGQFHNHYTRKEKLFFPIMERYGHDSPPKVMWGVDDEIRALFKDAKTVLDKLPDASLKVLSQKFEAFAKEFEEMIFKEEAILLMILLETFSQDDWLQIASESDAYGYAIIKPTEKWEPYRESFDKEAAADQAKEEGAVALHSGQDTSSSEESNTKIIDTPEGQFTITFRPKEKETAAERTALQPFGNGYLSVEQANLILNNLPLEITFVNKDDIFQYYNDSVPAAEMIFKRTPSQLGRNVELCHPPKVLDKVKKIFELLRSGKRHKVDMWFKSERLGKFVYVTYAAVRDEAGDFQGVLEYVQDIQPFFELDSDSNRDI
ncbi:DUF438 domain-containing protein [Streptococcus macacae]|uniref:Hemerythrin HHE cation binding domain protein n=1 Tax=Streptococcus macacae NCTC 11558 TaxID=764298 RepID=G5JVF4_9STRE|nr:DUF438 domain-containing protein [Streptococcus macacae]EHJ52522.1 hypothetical protein STRMA_0728 [Streptococcus macacae NCTC 11558]SUN78550.1 hemerythrin HHE cation binding domain subfamily, putative [Streptococcus macacae NCTC 11558]